MPKGCHGRLGTAVTGLLLLGSSVALWAQQVPVASAQADLATSTAEHVETALAAGRCPAISETPTEKTVPLPGSGVSTASPEERQVDAAPSSLCAPSVPQPRVRPSAPNIFGSFAVPLGSTRLDARWNEARRASLEGVDGPWNALIAVAGQVPDRDPLPLVNRWVNEHIRFVDDQGADSWSDAANTLIRGTGDCEDYAIAKMALLQRLGVPADDMFLVIVRDRLRQADHAVLAVRRDGAMRVLDNRTDMILTAEQITDYRPALSYNGPFAWIYGYQIGGRSVGAGQASRP